MASSSARPGASSTETADPQQTEEQGARLAGALQPGDVVLIRGELGAGKTTFVRGACRALGVTGPITSPTFAVGNRYRGAGVAISHLDLYRIASLDAEDPGLLADYLEPETIAFVEWPPVAAARFEGARRLIEIELSHAGGDRRRISSTLPAARPATAEPPGAPG